MQKIILNSPLKETNWYVITGGPSSGKTTTINILKERGLTTTFETARHYLDNQLVHGKTIEDVKNNQPEFQLGILNLQIAQENQMDPKTQVFLDRAIPDTLAYYYFFNIPPAPLFNEAIKNVSYKKIFVLESLPLVNDYARDENEEAQKQLHHLIEEVYESLPFEIVHVPIMEEQARVDFILKNI